MYADRSSYKDNSFSLELSWSIYKYTLYVVWVYGSLIFAPFFSPYFQKKSNFSSPGRSPGRAIVLPLALALVSALAKC